TLVRIEPRKGGQERRVDVEEAPLVASNEARSQYAHKTGHRYKARPVALDLARQGFVERLAALEFRMLDERRRNIARARKGEARCVRSVADDSRDRQPGFDERLHVAAAA